MKKILMICTPLLLAGLFTACDPWHSIDHSISNKSGHDVTIMSTYPLDYALWENNPDGIIIRNGSDTMFCTTEGFGIANTSEAEYDIGIWVYGDTVTFTFDDGKQLVYLKKSGDGVYDVESKHYSWSSEKELMSSHGHLAYTITEDEYNNAK